MTNKESEALIEEVRKRRVDGSIGVLLKMLADALQSQIDENERVRREALEEVIGLVGDKAGHYGLGTIGFSIAYEIVNAINDRIKGIDVEGEKSK